MIRPSQRVTVLRFMVDVTVPYTYSEEAKQTVRREILGEGPSKNKHHNHPLKAPLLEGMADVVTSRLGDLADGNEEHKWIRQIKLQPKSEML